MSKPRKRKCLHCWDFFSRTTGTSGSRNTVQNRDAARQARQPAKGSGWARKRMPTTSRALRIQNAYSNGESATQVIGKNKKRYKKTQLQ